MQDSLKKDGNNMTPLESMSTENKQTKLIRVYVDKDIEFVVDIRNEWLTCGWLLSEVSRKYTEAL